MTIFPLDVHTKSLSTHSQRQQWQVIRTFSCLQDAYRIAPL